jgi:hypothetical protein
MSALPTGSGRRSDGSTSHARPAAAAAMPIHDRTRGRSPEAMPQPIIVICTEPNSSSAPVAAPMRTYANVNGAA